MTDKQTEVDWRRMFVDYAAQVQQSESVAMLDRRDWTPEEWAAITKALIADSHSDFL